MQCTGMNERRMAENHAQWQDGTATTRSQGVGRCKQVVSNGACGAVGWEQIRSASSCSTCFSSALSVHCLSGVDGCFVMVEHCTKIHRRLSYRLTPLVIPHHTTAHTTSHHCSYHVTPLLIPRHTTARERLKTKFRRPRRRQFSLKSQIAEKRVREILVGVRIRTGHPPWGSLPSFL